MSIRLFGSIVLAACIAMTGCHHRTAYNCHGEFVYDTASFTVEQQGWIEAAAVRWNIFVGHTVVSVKPGAPSPSDACTIGIANLDEFVQNVKIMTT